FDITQAQRLATVADTAYLKKLRDAFYHVLLRFARDFRIDRQRQSFARGALSFWKIARFVAEIFKTRLLVQRQRIVNRRFNFALGEMLAQFIALRRSNHILMINVMIDEPALRIGFDR